MAKEIWSESRPTVPIFTHSEVVTGPPQQRDPVPSPPPHPPFQCLLTRLYNDTLYCHNNQFPTPPSRHSGVSLSLNGGPPPPTPVPSKTILVTVYWLELPTYPQTVPLTLNSYTHTYTNPLALPLSSVLTTTSSGRSTSVNRPFSKIRNTFSTTQTSFHSVNHIDLVFFIPLFLPL